MDATEWPELATIVEPVDFVDPNAAESVENLGATEGFAETNDPDSNDPRFRRVTIELHVDHCIEEPRNLLEIPDDAYDLLEAENEGGGGPNIPLSGSF